ncbi:uncharacterized protein SETTUDRAFT_33615 [Exserohilum turcica Et28A]|uniref:Uncharacterized protein n=1 Tax=Exserohilum turcicum (strain 28A) TaxID=671987 RepID=R0JQ53_EXST2|nr:uncharacterized protein SETTUDRAFT_33615 [Exserohilum turcica Et28A]EOA83313.1 hypothetical protein SETTUDRAFT_33615 [Exserohilum turcica Et28A]
MYGNATPFSQRVSPLINRCSAKARSKAELGEASPSAKPTNYTVCSPAAITGMSLQSYHVVFTQASPFQVDTIHLLPGTPEPKGKVASSRRVRTNCMARPFTGGMQRGHAQSGCAVVIRTSAA